MGENRSRMLSKNRSLVNNSGSPRGNRLMAAQPKARIPQGLQRKPSAKRRDSLEKAAHASGNSEGSFTEAVAIVDGLQSTAARSARRIHREHLQSGLRLRVAAGCAFYKRAPRLRHHIFNNERLVCA